MPGFDGKGPMGTGPMTGGARGFCNPANTGRSRPFAGGMGLRRGFRAGYGPGRNMRRGFGRGFGFYGWNPPAYDPAYPEDKATQINMLKAHVDSMKKDLDAINRSIVELENENNHNI